jgi:hypothetical protein
MVASARARCAIRGHMWGDAPYFIQKGPNPWGLKEVWVTNEECARPGCERTRRIKCIPLTYQLLTTAYGGKIDRRPGVTREELRREVIEEQDR